MRSTKVFNRIQKNGSRYYRTDSGEFPSVSTVLEATRPLEDVRRLNHWRKESALKIMRAFRTCANCEYYEDEGCNAGRKVRKNIHSKNRCQAYSANAAIALKIEEAKNKPRERGSNVHKNIEAYFRDGVVPEPEVCQFACNIIPFLKVLEPLYVEKELFSLNHKYAGTVDFIGEYRGQIIAIDWTSSLHIKPVQYYDHKFLQVAAYSIAAEELFGLTVDRMAVVVMSKLEAKLIDVDNSYREKFIDRVKKFHG